MLIPVAILFIVYDYPENVPVVQAKDESSEKVEYETKTVIVTPQRTVYEKQVRNVVLPDKDRDGIEDENDPHPEVAEIYIVSDEDKNGISDEYEQFFGKIRISK